MLRSFFRDWNFRDWWLVVCLSLLVFGMFYSPFVASVARGLIIIGIFLCLVLWKDSFNGFSKKIIPAICISSVFVLDIIGTLWSSDTKEAWHIITHEVSFLTVPVFIALCSPLKKNVITSFFVIYVFFCLLGTIVGSFNYIFTHYADIRHLIPGARHIAFALNSAFIAIVLFIYVYNTKKYRKIIIPIIIWIIVFLIIMQMLSGLIALILFAIIELVYLAVTKKNKVNIILSCIIIVCLVGLSFWIYREHNSYFKVKEAFIGNKIIKTPDGNTYSGIDDNFIENGYLVNNYVCRQEVESEWEKRTGKSIKEFCKDSLYSYEDLIYRYLNSKGLHKDAYSIRQLTDKDLENIYHGVANIVYAERFSLRPRLYQTFFEFERFINTKNVKDKSLIQRFAMINSASKVAKQNIFLGTGTSDAKKELKNQLRKDYPYLEVEDADPHNQFIYLLVNFGILGLLVFVALCTYPIIKLRLWENRYFIIFIFICICYMFVESALRMMAGRMFFVLFFSLFAFSNKEIKQYFIPQLETKITNF